jgi:hypothetical protein
LPNLYPEMPISSRSRPYLRRRRQANAFPDAKQHYLSLP